MSEYREIRGSLQGERCEHKSWADLCEKCEIDRLRAENEKLRAELREMDAHMEENITLTEALRHEQEWVLRLSKALRGIIRVADRNTVEFNEARAALGGRQVTDEQLREAVARAISDVRGPLYDGITLEAEKDRFRAQADAAIRALAKNGGKND